MLAVRQKTLPLFFLSKLQITHFLIFPFFPFLTLSDTGSEEDICVSFVCVCKLKSIVLSVTKFDVLADVLYDLAVAQLKLLLCSFFPAVHLMGLNNLLGWQKKA